jgi:ACT domain-containing protein
VRNIGAELEKGESVAVVLIGHVWATALEDAVARTGGTPVASEFVDATSLAELSDRRGH